MKNWGTDTDDLTRERKKTNNLNTDKAGRHTRKNSGTKNHKKIPSIMILLAVIN